MKLTKPQICILQLLYSVGEYGGLTKTDIAKRTKISNTCVGYSVGSSNPEQQAAAKTRWSSNPGLVELGYVVEGRIEDEEIGKHWVVSITKEGIKAYETLPEVSKRVGTTNIKGKYDWNSLLDGQTYKLTRGKSDGEGDYSCGHDSMRMLIYKVGKEHGKRVQVVAWKKQGESGLIIKATPMTKEEREVVSIEQE